MYKTGSGVLGSVIVYPTEIKANRHGNVT